MTIWDCSTSVLDAACTGLDPGELPDTVKVVPGPRFARDCTMLVVAPLTVADEAPTGGAGSDAVSSPRKRSIPHVPVWTLLVCYVEVCLPLPDNQGRPPDTAVYNAAVCEFIKRATAVWAAVHRARRNGGLFSPGFMDTCIPPWGDDIDCAGVEIGALTFPGPAGDSAWAEFNVTFQWPGIGEQ